MSKQQQPTAQQLGAQPSGGAPHSNWLKASESYLGRGVRTCFRALLLAGIMASLGSCAEERSDSESSEEPISQTTTDEENQITPSEIEEAATDNAAAPASQSSRAAGSRYRVTAETAYFFDAPEQGKPSGKYLLRGDVIYGEQESNGFVKTRFKDPNGATVAGWLKAQELSKLAATSAPVAARSSRPSRATSPPTTASEPDDTDYESAPVSDASGGAAETDVNESATAVVQVARSYFYNSPDLTQPRKAHCVRGDKVRLGESRGEAVFVTFTNWEKVTTTGWMRKDALRNSQ